MKLIFFIVILSYSFLQSAEAAQIDYGCSREIEVSLYDLGVLYSEKTQTGIDKDLIDLLSKETACKFKVTVKPRARIWSELKSGELTMSVSGIQNEERDKFAYFVNYLQAKNYVLIERNISNKISSFDDFIKLGDRAFVGVVRSFKHGKKIDEFLTKARALGRVKEFATANDVAKAFKSGEISLMFSLELVFPVLLKNINYSKDPRIFDWEEESVKHGLILSKKFFTHEQVKNWDQLIKNLLHNGQIESIIKKHVESKYLASVVIK